MATIYVSAVDGSNADSGATWALAKQTVAGALAIAVSNDIILVDNAGSFTATAAITWTVPTGNIAIISVNRSGGDAWAAGAAENVGAAAAAFTINGSNSTSLFVYGMTIKTGTSFSVSPIINIGISATTDVMTFDSCTFNVPGTSSSNFVVIGAFGGNLRSKNYVFDNCSFVLRDAAGSTQCIRLDGIDSCVFRNMSVSFNGANKPTVLFDFYNNGVPVDFTVMDSNLAAFNASSSSLVNAANYGMGTAIFKNVSLSSNTGVKTGTFPTYSSAEIFAMNVDSGDTVNTFEYYNRLGTVTEDTANYFTTGGASFNSTPLSWKVVTTSVCNEYNVLRLPPLTRWNTSTSSCDFNVQTIVDSATDLTDRELWLEVDYASSASLPTGSLGTDRNASPYTGTAVDQDNGTNGSWTTSGITNTNEQYVKVTATPSEVGLLEGRVCIAKASTTFWLDPVLRVSLP